MELKEIRLKSIEELNQTLKEMQSKLDDLNFKVRQKQLKNMREVRVIKKDIARILTVIKQKKA
ncbi:MAG: 50S ribosomal protein L29 [Patescibacteria group bacterium]